MKLWSQNKKGWKEVTSKICEAGGVASALDMIENHVQHNPNMIK